MLFQTLAPLLAERPIHLLLSASADGRLRVYIEPKATDKNAPAASVAPFSVCDTAEKLDAELATALSEWLDARASTLQDIQAGLAAAKASLSNAAAQDKKATPAKVAKPTDKSTQTFAAKAGASGSATDEHHPAPPPVMVTPNNIGSTSGRGDDYPLAVAAGPTVEVSDSDSDNPGEE